MSLERAKRLSALIVKELAAPAALVVPHRLRGAIADLAGELVEINQRLDKLENSKGGGDGKD